MGCIVCAITNGNADIRAIPSLAPLFDVTVTSESVGAAKPSPLPFESAIRLAGMDPETAGQSWVHVGDSFSEVCGASCGRPARESP